MPITYQYLTDRTLVTTSAITTDTLIHVVNTNDLSQNPAGSSYKAKLSQILPALSGLTFTGGSSNCISDLYVSNIHSCSPLLINKLNEGNVYFGSTSGITLDVINKRIGINTNNPQHSLHISGNTLFNGTLSATTISATTYLNLPTTTNGYLPLSGGTVTGGTVFNNGVTANTISQTSYIDFKTGATNPSAFAGRLFFDSGEEALTYYNVINSTVPIAIGQQLYTRVYNNTGVQIDKGKVIAITGTSNNLPSAVLATNNHAPGSPRPVGVAAENIPNGTEGLVINNGVLSGITINTFSNGDTLYLSDTVPGGYVSSTSSFPFSARTNEIGYVIQTGTTTGKIYVNINNEDSNLTLTDIERNILEGNVISTGAYEYTGMTINSSTTVNVAPMRGWIVQNTYSFATLPDVTNIYYTGGTGITITNIATADATYVLVNSASTLYQQTTYPTPQQRRENIFLGKVVHPNRTSLLTVNNTVDYDVSPMSALRDLWSPIKLINQGVLPSFNTGLTFNTSLGSLYGNGIGWTTNQLNPNSVTISAKTSASFFYRTQTGGTSGSVSVIDPTKYDVNGVITSVGTAGSNDATNQRIYLYPTGVINVLYGQTRYATLTEAIANIDSETFVTYPNAETTAILIGVISVRNDIVDDGQPLTNTNYAKLTLVSKFGESFGGTGGLSTTNLQQAYNNSTEPEILINSTLDGLSIQNGTGNADNVTQLLQGKNTAGTTTSFIRADGAISATTISGTSLNISGGSSSDLVRITQTGIGNSFVVEDSTNPDSTPFVIDTSGNTGIGTTTPTAKLHIKGIDSSSSNISFKVEDSSNRNILSARNDNFVYVGDNSVSSYLWLYGLGGQFGFSSENGFPYLFLSSSYSGGKFYFSNGSSGSGAFAQINTSNGNWLIGSPNTGIFSSSLTDTKLILQGADSTSSNYGLKVQNSGGTNNFVVRNDGNVGINTSTPQYTLDIRGSQSNLYYDPTSVGGNFVISGSTGIPRMGMTIPAYLTKPTAGFNLGMRAWNDATYPGYGKVGDAFFYAGNETNGFDILNPPGTGTEDYIRFYAGQTANGTTSDIHIQGSGSTRGYIGINNDNPEYLLDVSGGGSKLYYDPTSVGGKLAVSGETNVPRFGVEIPPYLTKLQATMSIGMRAWDDTLYPDYGNLGDAHLYAGVNAYGLNIISEYGANSADYIRFYAGQDAFSGNTPDMHIQGSGLTRGYVGIGVSSPTQKLQVSGNTLINGTLSATTISATTYQNLPTKEVFYKSHSANEVLIELGGFFEPAYNGGVSPVYISGIIPYDFGSNISSEIILISTASETQTIELNFSSGPVGGSFSATTANISFPKTYTQNIVDTVNVDNFFSGITANQVFSLNVIDNSGNYKLVIGIKFKYKPV